MSTLKRIGKYGAWTDAHYQNINIAMDARRADQIDDLPYYADDEIDTVMIRLNNIWSYLVSRFTHTDSLYQESDMPF